MHSMDPTSLIQEALDEARARDIATTVGPLFHPISVGQEEQTPEAARARDTDTTAVHTTLCSTSAGHTSPTLEGLQARVPSPTHAASSHAVSHADPREPPQPSSSAKEQLPTLQRRLASGSPVPVQLAELKNLGHDHRRANAASPPSSSYGGLAGATASQATWEPAMANSGCSAVTFSKFLHMQHKYESMNDDNEEECLETPGNVGDASSSAVVPSDAQVQRAREECGSEDWGTHLDDAKAQAAAARSCKRAREECGSLSWGTHLDDLNGEEASKSKVARTDKSATGPSIK